MRRVSARMIRAIRPHHLMGMVPPPLHLLINRVHPVSSNARLIKQALRQIFRDEAGVQILRTDIPAIEAYPRASTLALPVHRVEYRRPTGRAAPAALDTLRALARELFPQWDDSLARVSRKPHRTVSHVDRAF